MTRREGLLLFLLIALAALVVFATVGLAVHDLVARVGDTLQNLQLGANG